MSVSNKALLPGAMITSNQIIAGRYQPFRSL